VGPGADVARKVVVGDRVHIGLTLVVRDGIQVGEDAVIGAGAVVDGVVAAGTTVIRGPGRTLGTWLTS
jgi:maltose O-acetyltransferase